MQRKSFADIECNIARAVHETGDAWSLMILRNALLGARRFQDFEQQLSAPPTTLARRLQTLTERGFFVRRAYASHPPREEYDLTDKGREFLPVLLTLAVWSERWLSPNGAPFEFWDPETGERIDPVVVDARTGRRLGAGNVALRAGRGASARLKQAMTGLRVVFGETREGRVQ